MHSVRRVRTTAEQEAAKRKKEAGEIVSYRKQEELAAKLRADADAPLTEKLNATTTVLGVNPEHYTMWNFRREVLTAMGDRGLIEKDLAFVEKLLPRFPKVYWLWNHRRWVFEQLGDDAPWKRELGLVNKLLAMDGRNFHGWYYRRDVIAGIERVTGENMNAAELEFTRTKINSNFSNFSAWYRRSRLCESDLASKSVQEKAETLRQELEYSRSAIFMDPEDQSAWIYYRWLLTDGTFAAARPASLYSQEQAQLEELCEDEPNSVWCTYMLWVLSDIQKNPRAELLEKLQTLDPLRKNRYKYLLEKGRHEHTQ